jgi:hypothetical protein
MRLTNLIIHAQRIIEDWFTGPGPPRRRRVGLVEQLEPRTVLSGAGFQPEYEFLDATTPSPGAPTEMAALREQLSSFQGPSNWQSVDRDDGFNELRPREQFSGQNEPTASSYREPFASTPGMRSPLEMERFQAGSDNGLGGILTSAQGPDRILFSNAAQFANSPLQIFSRPVDVIAILEIRILGSTRELGALLQNIADFGRPENVANSGLKAMENSAGSLGAAASRALFSAESGLFGASLLSSLGKRDKSGADQSLATRSSSLDTESHDSPRLLSTGGPERQSAAPLRDSTETSPDDRSDGLVELDSSARGISKKKLWNARSLDHPSRQSEGTPLVGWNHRLWDADLALHDFYRTNPLAHTDADSGAAEWSAESSELIELLAVDLSRSPDAGLREVASSNLVVTQVTELALRANIELYRAFELDSDVPAPNDALPVAAVAPQSEPLATPEPLAD